MMKVTDLVKDMETITSIPLSDSDKVKFTTGQVYFLYGDSQTGKTWISCWLSKEASKEGYNVLFIDTEGKSRKFLRKWINEDWVDKEDLSNIELMKVDALSGESGNLMAKTKELADKIEKKVKGNKVDVLVIDTIISMFGNIHPKKRAGLIENLLRDIRQDLVYSEDSILLLITTQTYHSGYKGGQGLYYYSDTRIKLKPVDEAESLIIPGKRVVNYDRNFKFVITIDEASIKVVDYPDGK